MSSPAGRQSEHTTGPHRHEAAAPAVIGLLKPDMVLLMEAVELQLVLQKETAVRVCTADTCFYWCWHCRQMLLAELVLQALTTVVPGILCWCHRL